MENLKFRITSPEQSERLQKVLFELGYKWSSYGTSIEHTSSQYLFTEDNGCITYCNDLWFYDQAHNFVKVDAEAFIAQRTIFQVKNSEQTTPQNSDGEYTGKNVNYYLVDITNPKRLNPYKAEAEDIIEALGMTFAEGCAFKAIWRSCAMRELGVKKAGMDEEGVYDAEKVEYYGSRMLAVRKRNRDARLAELEGVVLK